MRMKALIDNKRILVADDTGVNGKTFTAVGSKLALDKKEGERHPTLVIAPNSGLLNAWSPKEIDRYAGIMDMPEQNTITVEKYGDLEKITPETDFAVLNWEKLSVREDDARWGKLDYALGVLDPKITVLDECHSAKGTNSLRGKTMQRITQRINGDRLMLLSATPIPNKYRDLGMIFHMLDPDKYQNPKMFTHTPPEVMKELLDRQSWFRLTRYDLKEEIGLPEFDEMEIPVNLSDEEAEIYFKGWADCVTLGQGLTELRKTLYNPALSKYGATFSGRSSKLEAITEFIDERVADGEKVILKTNYVTGILDDLVEAVGHDPLVVIGDTERSDRNPLFWQFKNNPKKQVLIVSSVGEESVDLTTGDTPLTLIPYEPEINPREFNQFSGRGYRRGQNAPVTHATFVTQSETLNQMMRGYLQTLADEHGIKVPKKFRPRTIDVDMLGMRRAKDSIVNKVYGGDRITKREESVYDASEVDRAVTHLEGLVKPSVFKDMQPFELSSLIQTRWRNLGEDQFESLVKSKGWKKWRNLYEDGWDGSASQATNVVLGKLVDKVQEDLGYEPVVVSVGDGRAYFSRAANRPSIGVDIDKKWLEQGKRDCEKKKIPYEFVHASATDTTLPDNLADVVVNAYSIFYLGQDEQRNEVESAIVESNRILKDDGRLMLALPCSIDDKVINRWNENMPEYGFTPNLYLGPNQTKNNGMKNGVHILGYQKTEDVRESLGKDLSFYLNREVFVG
jgi:superfamily II DNA or RNA helicase/SAM-dependent methyltransferase